MESNMQSVIDTTLKELDWIFERLTETTIVSGFTGKTGTFTFFIFGSPDWVILTSYAGLAPVPPIDLPSVCTQLARLNHDATFAKYSLDGEARIVLSVELPISGVNRASLDSALEAICDCTEELYERFSQYRKE
jgi:hypothetical protein